MIEKHQTLKQRLKIAKAQLAEGNQDLEVRDILLEVKAWLTKELDFYIESGISADEFINQKLRELE